MFLFCPRLYMDALAKAARVNQRTRGHFHENGKKTLAPHTPGNGHWDSCDYAHATKNLVHKRARLTWSETLPPTHRCSQVDD